MASKKAGGSTRTVNPNPKYRGVKKFGGEQVQAGNIIVRQCGNRFHPGENAGCGRDFTIFSKIDGTVHFSKRTNRKSKSNKIRKYINIIPNNSLIAE